MDQPSNTENGHYFEWNTKLASESSVSPLFEFQNFQFRFRIDCKGGTHFHPCLDLPNGGKHFLRFMVNTYTGYDNESFLIIYSLRVKSKLMPIATNSSFNCKRGIGTTVKFILHLEYNQLTSCFFNTNNQVMNCSDLPEIPCLKTLSRDFGKLLDAGFGQDVALKCGDRTVRAHKIVLGSRSKVFESMLHSGMVEGRTGHVEVKDMDSDVFQEFIEYLYSGDLPELGVERAKKLYEAGDLYAVDSLMRRCATFLSKNLTAETACEYLLLAEDHSDNEFKESVISYILEKKTPLAGESWIAFSGRFPAIAVDVLNRFVKLQNIV